MLRYYADAARPMLLRSLRLRARQAQYAIVGYFDAMLDI